MWRRTILWQIFIKVNRHIRTLEYFFLLCRFLLTNVLRYFLSRVFILFCCSFFFAEWSSWSSFLSKSWILTPCLEIFALSGKISKTARFKRSSEFLRFCIFENIWFLCSLLGSFDVCWGSAWFKVLRGSVEYPDVLFKCSCWSHDFQSLALPKETAKSVKDRTEMLRPMIEPFQGTELNIILFCRFFGFMSDCCLKGVFCESGHEKTRLLFYTLPLTPYILWRWVEWVA